MSTQSFEPEGSTEQCWTCRGAGQVNSFDGYAFNCYRCDGEGICLSIMHEWEKAGRLLQGMRRSMRIPLREIAHRLKTSPSKASNAEWGVIEPSTIGYTEEVLRQ